MANEPTGNLWPRRSKRIGAALALMAVVLAAYQPCLRGAFLWDDDVYVSKNPNLNDADGLIRTWTDPRSTPGAQFYPMVYTTFWIEHQLWGLETAGYHLVNVLLHGGCAVLLWMILRRLGVPGAYLAAALFALHPICVESAAWITERKNVLSLFFAGASLLAYLRFEGWDADPAADVDPGRAWRAYGISLVLFICALFSKTSTATLPFVIMALIWRRHGRVPRRLVLPLAPMMAAGLVLALLTISVEGEHMGTSAMPFFQDFTRLDRLLAAGQAAWFYVGKLLWPADVCFIYPQLNIDAASPAVYLYPLGIAAVLFLLWTLRSRIGRGPLTAVLIYLVVVGPALGFFDIAQMRFSLVADHWVYHASTAIIALVAAGMAMGDAKLKAIHAGLVVVPRIGLGFLLLVFFGLSWQQCHAYQSLNALWTDVVRKNPDAWIAQINLGILLTGQDKADEALPHLEAARSLDPDNFKSHHAMGNAFMALGRAEEAVVAYRRSLVIDPGAETALSNLGVALESLGRTDEAMSLYAEAVASGDDAFAAIGHYHIGRNHLLTGDTAAARREFHASLDLAPRYDRPRLALALLDEEGGESAP